MVNAVSKLVLIIGFVYCASLDHTKLIEVLARLDALANSYLLTTLNNNLCAAPLISRYVHH